MPSGTGQIFSDPDPYPRIRFSKFVSGSGSYLDMFVLMLRIKNTFYGISLRDNKNNNGAFLWKKDPDPDLGDPKRLDPTGSGSKTFIKKKQF